jgi:hypothetical protein
MVDCPFRLTYAAGPEMLGHLVGLRGGKFPIEVEIKL